MNEIPAYKKVVTQDLPKTTRIIDGLSNLWFAVTLMEDVPTLNGMPVYSDLLDEAYRIQVSSFKQSEEPILIVNRPTSAEQPITSYELANWVFDEYVLNYSSVVKAVTRDIQNMSIYKDKINYVKTQPSCCATCKFCEKSVTPKDYVIGVSNKLVCANPANEEEFDFNRDAKPNKAPICPFIPPKPQFVKPQVSPFGVCKNYVVRQRKWTPTPGDSVSRIIDERIDYNLSNLSAVPSISANVAAIAKKVVDNIDIVEIDGGDSIVRSESDYETVLIDNLGA